MLKIFLKGTRTPEYISPMPIKLRSNCAFCGKQAVCRYKAKFERLKHELDPLEVNCKYYEEWSGYNVK